MWQSCPIAANRRFIGACKMKTRPDYKCLPFYQGDELTGHLVQNDDRSFSFRYDAGWQGPAISPQLPLDGSAQSSAVFAWFRELIPGERRRRAFEKLTRLSLERIGQFLYWFGDDLPGNLSVKPASACGQPKEMTSLLAKYLAGGETLDRLTMGASLGGCAPKAALRVGKSGGDIDYWTASSASPSTHILKDSGLMAAIESCSMKLAAALGLFPVAKIEPVALGGKAFLLLERFDRRAGCNGAVEKLAQENFCQALGNLNRYGWERDGVSMEDMAGVFRQRLDAADLKFFLLMSFYAMFIGNSDDHAGNYALLRNDNGALHLAPAYDLASAAVIMELERQGRLGPRSMARFLDLDQSRKFGKHHDAMKIEAEDFRMAAEIFGLDCRYIMALAMECRERILECLDSGFILERREEWNDLALDDFFKEFGQTAIGEFFRIARERTIELGEVFEKAFRH